MANAKNTPVVKTKRSQESLRVDLRNIVVEEDFNCRKDYGDIDGLADSIIERGQLEPVKGYKVKGEDKFILTDGHRRFAAIKRANEKGASILTVLLTKSSSNKEDRVFEMLITGTGKKLLEPVEQADAINRLIKYGYSKSDIAKQIGKSHTYIAQMLRVANAPKEVKNLIDNGQVAANTVSKLMKGNSNEEVTEIIKESLKEKRENGDNKTLTMRDIKKSRTPDLTAMQKLIRAKEMIEQHEDHFDGDVSRFFTKLVNDLEFKNLSPEDIVNLVQEF